MGAMTTLLEHESSVVCVFNSGIPRARQDGAKQVCDFAVYLPDHERHFAYQALVTDIHETFQRSGKFFVRFGDAAEASERMT